MSRILYSKIQVNESIKKKNNKKQYKMDQIEYGLNRKHYKNSYPKRKPLNLSLDDSEENNNNVRLETDIEDKSSKGLEDKDYTRYQDLYDEDFFEEDDYAIEKEHKNKVGKVIVEDCKIKVTSEVLPLCENIPHTCEVTVGPVIVKIPVVLAECTVTITSMSSLGLEDFVLEINPIRKSVYLNQCNFIPEIEDGKYNTGIIFLEGFIRKNIEYTIKDHNQKGVSCLKVKNITVNVPFKCTTRVTFKTLPMFKSNTYQDVEKALENNEEYVTGRDIQEQGFRMIEFFNEKVFCQLISAEIVESDILENTIDSECKKTLEQGFHRITESVVIFLTIRLLQNQQVEILRRN
ncbi:MAG: hypothetical protein H7Y18_19890 [Clostridiaceae bacterium]|nr:hypothetical protein [Clostridiaceae bacterium]